MQLKSKQNLLKRQQNCFLKDNLYYSVIKNKISGNVLHWQARNDISQAQIIASYLKETKYSNSSLKLGISFETRAIIEALKKLYI